METRSALGNQPQMDSFGLAALFGKRPGFSLGDICLPVARADTALSYVCTTIMGAKSLLHGCLGQGVLNPRILRGKSQGDRQVLLRLCQ